MYRTTYTSRRGEYEGKKLLMKILVCKTDRHNIQFFSSSFSCVVCKHILFHEYTFTPADINSRMAKREPRQRRDETTR